LRILVFYTASVLILCGCIKEIPYNSDYLKTPLPAVHCFITPDSILTADCRLTAPFGSKDMPIGNAFFSIIKSNTTKDTTIYTGNGIHLFGSNSLKSGDTFVFRGYVNGYKFDISEIIPKQVFIKNFDTIRQLIPGIGRAFSVAVRFDDDAAFENYYRCYLYKTAYRYIYDYTGKLSDSFLQKDIISLYSDDLAATDNDYNNYSSRELLFSDATFNGVNKYMVLYTSDPLLKTPAERPVSIEFHLENISKSLFNFYNTRNAHIWQQQSISQLPGKIMGNVPGAFGVVGSYTADFRSFVLKR
jgi:hypothetical protein